MIGGTDARGILILNVIAARGLKRKKKNRVRGFCVVTAGSQCFKTRVVPKTSHPVWNQTVPLIIKRSDLKRNRHVTLSVYHKDRVTKNRVLGTCKLSIANLTKVLEQGPRQVRLILGRAATGKQYNRAFPRSPQASPPTSPTLPSKGAPRRRALSVGAVEKLELPPDTLLSSPTTSPPPSTTDRGASPPPGLDGETDASGALPAEDSSATQAPRRRGRRLFSRAATPARAVGRGLKRLLRRRRRDGLDDTANSSASDAKARSVVHHERAASSSILYPPHASAIPSHGALDDEEPHVPVPVVVSLAALDDDDDVDVSDDDDADSDGMSNRPARPSFSDSERCRPTPSTVIAMSSDGAFSTIDVSDGSQATLGNAGPRRRRRLAKTRRILSRAATPAKYVGRGIKKIFTRRSRREMAFRAQGDGTTDVPGSTFIESAVAQTQEQYLQDTGVDVSIGSDGGSSSSSSSSSDRAHKGNSASERDDSSSSEDDDAPAGLEPIEPIPAAATDIPMFTRDVTDNSPAALPMTGFPAEDDRTLEQQQAIKTAVKLRARFVTGQGDDRHDAEGAVERDVADMSADDSDDLKIVKKDSDDRGLVPCSEFLDALAETKAGHRDPPSDRIIVTFGPGAVPTDAPLLAGGEVYASAEYISQSDMEQSLGRTLVELFDGDGDGLLDPQELSLLLQSLVQAPLEDSVLDDALALVPDSSGSSDGLNAKGVIRLLGARRLPLLIRINRCPVCGFESDLPDRVLEHMPICAHGVDLAGNDSGVVGNLVGEEFAAAGWVSRVVRKRKPNTAGGILGPATGLILVQDRDSGEVIQEKLARPVAVGLRILYRWGFGRKASDTKRIRKMLRSMTLRYGRKYNAPQSKRGIAKFIAKFSIDVSEFEHPVSSFQTFNDFFIRTLKPGARPIEKPSEPHVAVSPCDCRLVVFSDISSSRKLWIKGDDFSLDTLVQDAAIASKYHGGAMAICRLAPQDYHRYHFPVDGVLGPGTLIDGEYYTVSPLAVRKNIDVFTKNKRMWNEITSAQFGSVLYMTVGATMVGSIVQTSRDGDSVVRGDEHGHFSFGGSTVILLFEPQRIIFDRDLILNSGKPLETFVKMGTRIGVAVSGVSSTGLDMSESRDSFDSPHPAP